MTDLWPLSSWSSCAWTLRACFACPACFALPAGNEVQAALSACLPSAITLQCLPVAWLPGGLVELQVTGKYQECWSCVCAVCGWRLGGTVQQISRGMSV